nr:hypothetical protein [Tanacetum cinerariifolium]
SQNEITIAQNKLMDQLTSMCAMVGQLIQKKQEEKRIEEEQTAKAQNPKIPICYDDDDDYNSAITPNEPSLHNEDVPEKIFSNPLFEEIISKKIDLYHFDAESGLIESMINHDSSIISSSSKIDSLLDEFAGELTILKSIPPGIDKTDCHPENEIRIIERLLYDNSSPRPPEEFLSAKRPMMIRGKNIPFPDVLLFHFYPLDKLKYERNWVKLSDLKQALRGSHPMLIIVQYSWKFKDSCQRILSSKSSFPQLHLGIILLHLAGSPSMLKSSNKAEDGVIISIPSLVGGVTDVVVEIKGTGWSISITFQFSVGLQTPDDLSRSYMDDLPFES